MSRLGSYEVHKADTKTNINPKVLNVIALARLTQRPRDFIDCLFDGKTVEALREEKSDKRIKPRKEDLDIGRE